MKYIETLKTNNDEYKQQLEERKALYEDQVYILKGGLSFKKFSLLIDRIL